MAAPAAPQGFPKKPHSAFPEQPPNLHQIPSKSHSNALCKTLIIAVLLLVIPLFPSQAPDFITESILTEFWEIIHLLFIGIAVSYGLFGRRSPQIDPDRTLDSRIDDSRSYLSGISQLNSFFDDGYDNIDMHSYANCECLERSRGRCVVHSAKKIRSLVSDDGAETESVCENNVRQTWSSQYVKGESLVVVSDGKYFVGGSSDFEPLNLPVRSLRSRAVDVDDGDSDGDGNDNKPELKNRNESCSKIEAEGCGDDVKVVKIRGVVPQNLEKRFEEVSGRSPIPWRSRSGRMEYGEERRNSRAPAHCRPHSVGDFEFEQHLKSRGAKFSASPELGSSKMESGKRKRVFKVPKIAPVDTEVSSSFGGAVMRPLSNGASSNTNRLEDLESNQENFIDHSGEELGKGKGKGKEVVESLEINPKSSGIAKVVSRAKSVRTIKPNRSIKNHKEHCLGQIIDNHGRICEQSEADSSVERGKGQPQSPPFDHQNQGHDRIFTKPKPKPTLPEFVNEEKQDTEDGNGTEPEEHKESENDRSSDEGDARDSFDNDSEFYGSEVDRKAGEFIAKFREQIRLQKTSSIKGHSGLI